eukprot:g11.t1
MSTQKKSGSIAIGDCTDCTDGHIHRLWEVLTDNRQSSPAISEDGATVFVGSGAGVSKLNAINAIDGTKKWEFLTAGDVNSSPTLSSDGATVFVGSANNMLFALNTADGSEKWKFPTGGAVRASSPALSPDGDTVFLGSEDGKVYAIDAATGNRKWDESAGDTGNGAVSKSSPVVSKDGAMVFATSYNNLYAFDTANGAAMWVFKTITINGQWRSSPMVSADGVTLFAGSDDRLRAIDVSNPRSPIDKWDFETGGMVESSPTLSPDGATVFTGSSNGKIFAINAIDGTMKWEFLTGGDVHSSPTLSSDGATVFVGSDDNKLYAFNVADGTKKWEFLTGGHVHSSPALSPDGETVFVGSEDGKLYAVNAGGCGPCRPDFYLPRSNGTRHLCRNMLDDPDTKKLFGMLYMSYKPDAYWFESVQMLFKLALWASLCFFKDDPQIKIAVAQFICFLQVALHAHLKPFNTTFKNICQAFALLLSFSVSFGGLVINFLQVSQRGALRTAWNSGHHHNYNQRCRRGAEWYGAGGGEAV